MNKKDERKKASDISNISPGTFLNIKEITIEIEETNHSNKPISKKIYKGIFGEYFDCNNPVCYGGGISIGSIVREMVKSKLTSSQKSSFCRGYEGTARRKVRECLHHFVAKVHIIYNAEDNETVGGEI